MGGTRNRENFRNDRPAAWGRLGRKAYGHPGTPVIDEFTPQRSRRAHFETSFSPLRTGRGVAPARPGRFFWAWDRGGVSGQPAGTPGTPSPAGGFSQGNRR